MRLEVFICGRLVLELNREDIEVIRREMRVSGEICKHSMVNGFGLIKVEFICSKSLIGKRGRDS